MDKKQKINVLMPKMVPNEDAILDMNFFNPDNADVVSMRSGVSVEEKKRRLCFCGQKCKSCITKRFRKIIPPKVKLILFFIIFMALCNH